MTDRAAREADEDAREAEEADDRAEQEADEGTEEAARGENGGVNGRIRAGEDAECGSFTQMNLRYGAGMGNTGSPSQRGQFEKRGGGRVRGDMVISFGGRKSSPRGAAGPAENGFLRPLIDSPGARNVQS